GGDCDDTNPTTYPGAPQLCDGRNDDCSSPVWPSLTGTNEMDDDGDGYSECQGDCDDTRGTTHPGAFEVNDGRDNECSGDPGFGTIDEISGDTGFADPNDTSSFCWTAQTGATAYQIERADDALFSANCQTFLPGNPVCIGDAQVPPPDGVLYYLVRAIT